VQPEGETTLEANLLSFEGVIGYSAGDGEEAAHFFEHTLGLELGAEDGGMRFYALSEGVTLTVDVSGGMAGQPPYLLFSSPRVVEAAEHFLQRGCQVRELPWAPSGAGFFARSPEGHTVAVIDGSALEDGQA
jgi:predicted enzyme related to lactoylglutathione lyase